MGNSCCPKDTKPSLNQLSKTYKMSTNQIVEYEKMFHQHDKNGDGQITASELGIVLDSLGRKYSSESLTDMIESFDKDHSGGIEFEEFLALLVAHPRDEYGTFSEKQVSETFDGFDRTKAGTIHVADIPQTMNALGVKLNEREVGEIIAEVDPDNEGRISKSRFKMICKKWLKQKQG